MTFHCIVNNRMPRKGEEGLFFFWVASCNLPVSLLLKLIKTLEKDTNKKSDIDSRLDLKKMQF